MRVLRWISYLAFIFVEVVRGSLRLVRLTLSRSQVAEPAIVELVTNARTDLEISLLSSSITITPGTLVLGVSARWEEKPPSLFVHSMFDGREALVGLRELETRLLRATRKEVK